MIINRIGTISSTQRNITSSIQNFGKKYLHDPFDDVNINIKTLIESIQRRIEELEEEIRRLREILAKLTGTDPRRPGIEAQIKRYEQQISKMKSEMP